MRYSSLRAKKAQEMFPILVFLALMVAFSVFFMLRLKELGDNAGDPFYGSLGQREFHLLALAQAVEGDLFVLDLLAEYAAQEAIHDAQYFSEDCGTYIGYPIISKDNAPCFTADLSSIANNYTETFNNKLYTKVLSSDLYFPFKYRYSLAQDDDFHVIGNAHQAVHYPINSKEFAEDTFKPIPVYEGTAKPFDISALCTYIGKNARDADTISGSDSFSERTSAYAVGACPKGLQPELVPYFNQCNIPECEYGSCRIDYQNICLLGCGFKSLQMAYAYYGYTFDELSSPFTDEIYRLLTDMRLRRPDSITESPTRFVSGARDSFEIIFGDGSKERSQRVRTIDDEDYDELIAALDNGIVRIKIATSGPMARDGVRCNSRRHDELTYCVNQHFILVLAGDEDHVVVHDPYTPSRKPSTGINVVLTKEYIKKIWTGEYVVISDNA